MEYQIIRRNRKTIAIQIKVDGQIVVRCPIRMQAGEVERFVASKESWIRKHLSRLRNWNTEPFEEREIENCRKQAEVLVCERVAHYASEMGVSYGRITIRTQKTRWGSCSSKGNLSFNALLAVVPADVLDYVVVHELCHLRVMNHSEQFWEEVRKILPNYEQSKLWLRENGSCLIARL